MRIERFRYVDKALQWELQDASFSDLTLLVGVSGVGKTQILRALLNTKGIASGTARNGVSWEMVFSTKDRRRYRWRGEYETREQLVPVQPDYLEDDQPSTRERPRILCESLFVDDEEIVKRTAEDIFLNGKKTPKLSPTSSILNLLAEEDSVQPASEAFQSILHSDQSTPHHPYRRISFPRFDKLVEKYGSLEKIQRSDLDTQTKLALVYKSQPETFREIESRFVAIFPHIQGLKIEPVEDEKAPFFVSQIPILQIREEGVANWIDQWRISSGMLRTIFHLAEMYLWPEGTVILIDEFENSLGVNCIDVLTEDLCQPHRNLQFILTSHHPYVINAIRPKSWKVVRRKGGVVEVHDAATLGLGESSHEAFIQLINSEQYRDGIALA